MFEMVTALINMTFDAHDRLSELRDWQNEWKTQSAVLDQRIRMINPEKPFEVERARQIASLRQRLRLRQVRKPLEIPNDMAKYYSTVQTKLREQYVSFSTEDKLLWLNNLIFLVTPEIWSLHQKILQVYDYYMIGEQRNFLLGGPSGVGKTTYLNFLASMYLPTVEGDHNRVPIIKIDGAISQKSPRTLFRRLLLEFGATYTKNDQEEDLLNKFALYIQKCGSVCIIVDEVEHIKHPDLRRRLLDISNMTPNIPIICSSVNPERWTDGDEEVRSRWNDSHMLSRYTGEKLSDLLFLVELILPFSKPSNIYSYTLNVNGKEEPGPAKIIAEMTGGTLREVMGLLREASKAAILNNLPCLDLSLLEITWWKMKTKPIVTYTDFD